MTTAAITAITGFGHLTDLPCYKLEYAGATAVISLYGGQVLSYKPTPEQERLWLSSKASWHNQQPIRGGVPICWPWFGAISAPFMSQKLASQQKKFANHGLVRNRMWQLEQQHCDQNAAQIKLAISVNDLPYHTGCIQLFVTVTLTDSLTITLDCDTKILQQAALHSYFKIGNLTHTTISPLPKQYQQSLSLQFERSEQETVVITEEIDRIYANSAKCLQLHSFIPSFLPKPLLPPGLTPLQQQNIFINQHGHDATVLWNPWQKKCQQLNDTNPDDYLHFVCIETARLALTAKPLLLSQNISSRAKSKC